jgi:hypothetical protein
VKRKALAAVLAVLVLAGCAGAPQAGTIQDKRHERGFWYTTMQCTGYSGKGYCQTQMPVQHYSPPSWAFDLYDGDDHGWRNVDPETYSRYAVGDYYPGEGR